MVKIGRNNPCPCGSGKKFKRCHGSLEEQQRITNMMNTAETRAATARVQRERQQGFGKPIISAEAFGQRFVAVKNRLLHSQKWLTFHDFLVDYLRTAMGSDWGNAELAKPFEKRHPILIWYYHLCEYQKSFIKEPGKVHSASMTGAAASFMHLAYDLYTLDHNAELQQKLIGRLRNHDNFPGARYEIFVAATLIRAGFEIEFENEDDRSSSHCEFTAKYTRTGKLFSVEAKHRVNQRFRLGQLLNGALAKQAKYQRIVFIDVDVPDGMTDLSIPTYLQTALAKLRSFEGKSLNGNPLPAAYLYITNTPWHHNLDGIIFRSTVLADGFQITDFKPETPFPSLRAAIEARERHIELHELLRSMRVHTEIPSTFDGEIPAFAFGEGAPRLKIGKRYLGKDENGIEYPGLLTTATVIESERLAYFGLALDNGKSIICSCPLSDVELAAWRRHPDTFFGELVQQPTVANSPLDLYDSFFNSYRETSRERLLEFMSGAIDIENLRKLDQLTLASIYAERCANHAIAIQSRTGPLKQRKRQNNRILKKYG